MKIHNRLPTVIAGLIVFLLAGIGISQTRSRDSDAQKDAESEFRIARIKYPTVGGGGSHGYFQPWWAIDYPLAEEHFLPALRRVTNIKVSDEEAQLELSDDRIFEYP